MISSCKDCKSKCCKTGPGPHKKVKSSEYLENFGTFDAYNTKCENMLRNGKCKLWGTKDFPIECRVYVCQSRKYSKKELETINRIYENEYYGCFKCGCSWQIWYEFGKYRCEICGNEGDISGQFSNLYPEEWK